jgi:hypothetical protein
LAVIVHVANIHDTKSAEEVMKKALKNYPSLQAFSADEGSRKTVEEAARSLGKELSIYKKLIWF